MGPSIIPSTRAASRIASKQLTLAGTLLRRLHWRILHMKRPRSCKMVASGDAITIMFNYSCYSLCRPELADSCCFVALLFVTG